MLRQSVKNKKKGFTIIEVVLVLAIAGLIFLMVFVAFPQLQRNQRDTQRRNDMARFLTAVMNYQTNNRNRLPFIASGTGAQATYKVADNFVKDYLTLNGADTFQDPVASSDTEDGSDDTYTIVAQACNADTTKTPPACSESSNQDLGVINVYIGATCDGETPIAAEGNRKMAFTLKLEGAGTYCGQN